MHVEFVGLGLVLRASGKRLLRGVTGQVRHSRLTAVMGPSGAGAWPLGTRPAAGRIPEQRDTFAVERQAALVCRVPEGARITSKACSVPLVSCHSRALGFRTGRCS